MKKLFLGLIATVMFSSICHSQEKVVLESSVSQEEFKASSESEKRLLNFIDAGIAALKGLELQGPTEKKYAAIISFSSKDDKLQNSVIISESEGELPSAQSCVVCGTRTAVLCIKRIISSLGNGPLIITLEREGDCYKVSWPDV